MIRDTPMINVDTNEFQMFTADMAANLARCGQWRYRDEELNEHADDGSDKTELNGEPTSGAGEELDEPDEGEKEGEEVETPETQREALKALFETHGLSIRKNMSLEKMRELAIEKGFIVVGEEDGDSE